MEHAKPTPLTGSANDGGNIYDNKKIAAALYWGWNGTNNIFTDRNQGIVVTSLVLSELYTGVPSGTNTPGYAELMAHAQAEDVPDDTISFSSSSVNSSINGNEQRSETIIFNGDLKNTVSFKLPAEITFVNQTTGQVQAGGTVTIKGGDSFYLSAPLSYDADYHSGVLKGSMKEYAPILYKMTNSSLQSLVRGVEGDPLSTINFKVHFEAREGQIEVSKAGNNTSSLIPGATYRITDEAGSEVDVLTTGSDGKAKSKGLQPNNMYKVTEIASPSGYTIDPTEHPVYVNPNQTSNLTVTNEVIRGQVKLKKEDAETSSTPQGDATLVGAKYGIYADQSCTSLIDEVIIGSDLTATSNVFEIGASRTIYIKEISAPVGYNLDPTVYPVVINQVDNVTEVVVKSETMKDEVIKGSIDLEKFYSEADGESAMLHGEEGAEFSAYLESTGQQFGETVTTNKDGHAAFSDMPYGWYVIKQTKTPPGKVKVDDFRVNISGDGTTQYYNMVNAKFRSLVKIVKVDAETGKTIPVANTTFKVKDLQTGKWVTQTVNYPAQITLDEFKTNSQGELMLPEPLEYGEYELYEVAAPNGYVLNEKPSKFTVNQENQTGQTIEVKFSDMAQKGIATLTKTGDVLTGAEKEETEFGDQYDLIFEQKALKGAEFDFIAAEDIITPDGTVRANEGDIVGHGVTDEEGQVKTPALYLGKYYAVETKAPVGMVLTGMKLPFELNYAGQEIAVTSTAFEAENELQQLQILINKTEEVLAYENGQPAIASVPANDKTFGVYARDAIKVEGKEIVPTDGLLAVATTEAGIARVEEQFPEGNYYVQELDAGSKHDINPDQFDFTFTATNNGSVVTIDMYANENNQPIANELHKEKLILNKQNESIIYPDYGFSIDENSQAPESQYNLNGAGAEFGIYQDGNLVQTLVIGEDGTVEVALYVGKYQLKELKPSSDLYDLTDEVWDITVTKEGIEVADSEGKEIDLAVGNMLTINNELHKEALTIKKLNEVLEKQGEEWVSHYAPTGAGTQFELYQNNSLIQRFAIGENSTVKLALPIGEYQLKEVNANSDDYLINDEVWTITVTKDELLVSDSKGDPIMLEENALVIKNDLKKGEAEISKQEVRGSKELPGATLNVVGEDFDTSWVSTNEPKKLNLREGTYTLTETLPNDGYELNTESITFEVKNGETTNVVMHNKRVPEPAAITVPTTGDDKNRRGSLIILMLLSMTVLVAIGLRSRMKQQL